MREIVDVSVGSLFLDLSKAFDLVDYTILIQKLSFYGLHNSDTDWFNSYLNSRTQISGEQPKPGEITAGCLNAQFSDLFYS